VYGMSFGIEFCGVLDNISDDEKYRNLNEFACSYQEEL
jgi:hypothetical protein